MVLTRAVLVIIILTTCQTVTTSSDPATNLHDAAAKGNMELILKLLAIRTTAIDTPNGQEETAVYVALKHNQSKAALVLLDNCANVNIRLSKGRTLLHLASAKGDLSAAQLLVNQHGLSTYKPDENGQTPLHYATAGRHLKLVRFLMDHGARHVKEWKNYDGESPFDYASRINNPIEESFALQLVQLFANYPKLQESLTSACLNSFLYRVIERDYRSVINFLLNQTTATFDLNQAVLPGFKLLHYCAVTGNVGMAKLLLDNGANVDGTSSVMNVEFSGGSVETPLELAVRRGHLEMVKLLREKENFNFTCNSNSNSNSNSACYTNSSTNLTKLLSRAFEFSQTEMVHYLLRLGANLSEGVNHFMESNQDSFFDLSTNVNLTLLVLSDEHTFDQFATKFKSYDGNWLSFGLHSGNLAVIKFLLEVKQIPLNITDWKDYCYRALAYNTEIVDYLLAKGALDVNGQNNLLLAAVQIGQFDIVRHLISTSKLNISSDSKLIEFPIHSNNTALFKYLIRQGAPLPKIEVKVPPNWNSGLWYIFLLHTAASNANLDIFKYLFEHQSARMDTNNIITELFNTVIDNQHKTNLHAQLELLKWIVSKSDKPIKFDPTNSPLYNAIRRNKPPIVRYLLDELHYYDYKQTLEARSRFIDSTVGDWLPMVKLLIDRLHVGVLSSSSIEGFYLSNLHSLEFHFTVKYVPISILPHYNLVKYLIFDYRNVQAQNRSIVHTIAAQGNVNLLKRIVRFGADLAVVDTLGRTPLHVAALNGQVEVVKWLLHNHKCSAIGTKDANQETALDLLAHYVTST